MGLRRRGPGWTEKRAASADARRWATVSHLAEQGETYRNSVLVTRVKSGPTVYEGGYLMLSDRACYLWIRPTGRTNELCFRIRPDQIKWIGFDGTSLALRYEGDRVDDVAFGTVLAPISPEMNIAFGEQLTAMLPPEAIVQR